MGRPRAVAQIGLLGIDILIRAAIGLAVGTLVAIKLGPSDDVATKNASRCAISGPAC